MSRVALIGYAAIAVGAIVLTLGCSGEAASRHRDVANPTEGGVHHPCIADHDAWAIEAGSATGQVDEARSPEQLIESSPIIVLGGSVVWTEYVSSAYSQTEGTTLAVKVSLFLRLADAQEVTFQKLWTPAELDARFDRKFVSGNYVAFLNGKEHEGQMPVRTGTYVVHADGLWMACDDDSPAVRIMTGGTGSKWDETLDTAMTLAELRELVRASDRHSTRYTFGPTS